MTEACVLCERLGLDRSAGGWIVRTQLWAVCPHPALQAPGWFCLTPTRHVESFAGLTNAEAAELGARLRELDSALRAVTDAEYSHAYSLGANVRHLHILLGVAQPGGGKAARGAALLKRVLDKDATLVDVALTDSTRIMTQRILSAATQNRDQ